MHRCLHTLRFYEVSRAGGFDAKVAGRMRPLPAAQAHVLAQEEGNERMLQGVAELSEAFVLAIPQGVILPTYGYQPDKQEAVTKTVLTRAEPLSESWTHTQ